MRPARRFRSAMFKGGFIVSGAEVNLASDTSPQTPYVPLMDRGSLGPVVCSIRLRFLIPANGLRAKWIHIHRERARSVAANARHRSLFRSDISGIKTHTGLYHNIPSRWVKFSGRITANGVFRGIFYNNQYNIHCVTCDRLISGIIPPVLH